MFEKALLVDCCTFWLVSPPRQGCVSPNTSGIDHNHIVDLKSVKTGVHHPLIVTSQMLELQSPQQYFVTRLGNFFIIVGDTILQRTILHSKILFIEASSFYHCVVPPCVCASLLILLVFLSWSRIFFSISWSVRVSRKGDQVSASVWVRKARLIVGRWLSANAYVFWCQASWEITGTFLSLPNERKLRN